MDLRSSRSRSKTPFVVTNSETTKSSHRQNGTSHVEETVVQRTTRSSTHVKTSNAHESVRTAAAINDRFSDRSEPERIKFTKEAFNNHKLLYKSFDYCSDEDSDSVKSNRSFRESSPYLNASMNGGSSPVSALQLYRDAGEYWNKFPKTDYTYSPHSKDRVELAPGIVAMPNMSRRSLMHTYSVSGNVLTLNKHSGADSFTRNSVSDYSGLYQRQPTNSQRYSGNNNSYKSYYTTSSSYSSLRQQSFFTRVTTTIVSFWLLIQNSFLNATSNVSRRVSNSWMSLSSDTRRWLSLLTILLLFFTGLWLLSAFATGPLVPLLFPNISQEEDNFIVTPVESSSQQIHTSELTQAQINAIISTVQSKVNDKLDTESIVQQIMESNSFKLMLYDLKSNEKDNGADIVHLNDKLMNEIDKVKSELYELDRLRQIDLTHLIGQLKSENAANNARMSVELKRCCRSQLIYVESYVNKLLSDILSVPRGFGGTQEGIKKWLHTIFVARDDLEEKLLNVTQHLREEYDAAITGSATMIMDEVSKKISMELSAQSNRIRYSSSDVGGLSDERVKRIVLDALAVYDADKTGMVDYALEPSGGQVLSTRCTESYHARTAVMSVLGIPLWYPMNTPRTVITPGITPGECWAFQNFPGFLVIKLTARIKVTAFSVEHVPKSLMANGRIESAPKDFSVYGLLNENDKEPVLLGEFQYDHDGPSLQHFAATSGADAVFDLVEVRILSNHGNPSYTCLYRFRVHGTSNHGLT